MDNLTLTLQPAMLGICRLESPEEIPSWVNDSEFFSITKTKEELSIVCPEQNIPDGTRSEKGWRAF